MMRGRNLVTSVLAVGFSFSGQVWAQGAPKPPAPTNPAPAPAKPVAPPAAPPPAATPPATGGAPTAPTPPPPSEPTEPSATHAAAPPPPAPMPVEPAPAPPPAEIAPMQPPSADPEPDLPPAENYSEGGGDSWYDSIEFSAFADAYFGLNYNFPKPQSGRNNLRAFDSSNGFALSWVGVNASYPADPVGATVSLRFGPTARAIGLGCFSDPTNDPTRAQCDSGQGLENVKQAFASWKPGGADSMLQLDLGKFDTPFGAEVAESHLNMNYTRSMLFVSQPVFHTGIRASFAVADAFDFKLLAVNGWNNSIDNNAGKSFGAQANFHVKNADDADMLGVSLGYMIGPEHDDTALVQCKAGERFSATAPSGCAASTAAANVPTSGVLDRASSDTKGLRHLIDLVVTANPIKQLRLVLNADYGLDHFRDAKNLNKFDSASYYGVLLGARVAIVDQFGVAARGEFFHDTNGFVSGYGTHLDENGILIPATVMNLAGGTLTLDYLPSDFLTIRLDNRVDWSSREIFNKGLRDRVGQQFTTTLGVVAHTD